MKSLRYALLLVGLMGGGLRPAAAQVFDWARLARNMGRPDGYSQAATTDRQGNTYASVRFRDSVRVGPQTIRAAGVADVLVKYDSTGRVAWTKLMRGVIFDRGGLRISPAGGELFVSGQLAAGATWDGAVVLPGGVPGFFYGKCAPTGALLWARARPYFPNLVLAADDQGNAYLLGQAAASGTVGGFGVDSSSVALWQTSGAGAVQWLRKLRGGSPPGTPGGPGLSVFYGLGPQPGGGCLVFGQFLNTLYFGSGPSPVQTGAGLTNFVAQVDGAGALRWSRPAPGLVTAAAADAAANYYLTGAFPLPATAQTGVGVAKYNGAGAVQWTRTQTPVGNNFEAGRLLAVDDAGNVTLVADGNPSAAPGAGTVLGNLPLRAAANVVRLDAQGQALWVANDWWPGSARAQTPYAQAVALGLDARGNAYYVADISGDSLRPRPALQLGALTLVGAGVALARIGSLHNTIAGRVYFDQNGNGRRDAGEGPFPGAVVLQATQPAGAPATTTPDAAGDYRLVVGAGAYRAEVLEVPAHYAVSEPVGGAYTGNFVGYGRVDSARAVGLRPVANQVDLRATLTPYGAARPGFITRYRLTLENVGTTAVQAGTATVTLDARVLYVGSVPAAPATGRVVSWTYPALAPFARRELDLTFSLPTNTPVGTTLTTTAAAPLAADVVPADNTATATQTVTGPFDPNDITVNYARLTPAQVAARLPLDYTVRFQNVGTDTAFTVVVSDTLDVQRLNAASTQLVAQSHNCVWSLTGKGELTVRFLDIKLPYRNQDVIRSQGFVRFRVQPRPTLAVGEVIPNHARITFDFSAPVRTNTATTTVVLATATLATHPSPAWDAYPNPATDAVTVAADLATAGPVRLELLDALGRSVRAQVLAAPAGPLRQLLDLRGLPAGLYVLRLTPPGGPALSRQVVRE